MSRASTPRALAMAISMFGVAAGVLAILDRGVFPLLSRLSEDYAKLPLSPIGVAVLLVSLALFGFFFVSGAVAQVEVDDAGVRWVRGRTHGYVPFESLLRADVRSRASGGAVLVLGRAEGDLRLSVATDSDPQRLLGSILKGMSKTRSATSTPAVWLKRDGRDLTTWLAAVRERATDETSYRAAALDVDALETMLADPSADADVRAAAAHVLLSLPDLDRRARAAKSILATAPPIVVVAAALADPACVDPDLVAPALAHLDERDRVEAKKALGPQGHVRIAADAPAAEPLEEEASERDERRVGRAS